MGDWTPQLSLLSHQSTASCEGAISPFSYPAQQHGLMGKAVKLSWWVLSEDVPEGKEGVCCSCSSLGGGLIALAGVILAPLSALAVTCTSLVPTLL